MWCTDTVQQHQGTVKKELKALGEKFKAQTIATEDNLNAVITDIKQQIGEHIYLMNLSK